MLVEVFIDEVAVDDYADPGAVGAEGLPEPPIFRGYAEDEESDADEIDPEDLRQRRVAGEAADDPEDQPVHQGRAGSRKGGDTVVSYVQRLISTIPEFNGTLRRSDRRADVPQRRSSRQMP